MCPARDLCLPRRPTPTPCPHCTLRPLHPTPSLPEHVLGSLGLSFRPTSVTDGTTPRPTPTPLCPGKVLTPCTLRTPGTHPMSCPSTSSSPKFPRHRLLSDPSATGSLVTPPLGLPCSGPPRPVSEGFLRPYGPVYLSLVYWDLPSSPHFSPVLRLWCPFKDLDVPSSRVSLDPPPVRYPDSLHAFLRHASSTSRVKVCDSTYPSTRSDVPQRPISLFPSTVPGASRRRLFGRLHLPGPWACLPTSDRSRRVG